jgi:hypothetical protein
LYINDLPLATADNAISILFDDDTSLLVIDKSLDTLETKVNESLKKVNKWFKSNLLTVNFSKTFSMQFASKNTVSTKASTSLNINGIVEVSHFKFLGLKTDDALSWNIHIDSVINKLTTVCFMIRCVGPYMTLSSLVNIYYSVSFNTLIWYCILGAGNQHQEALYITEKGSPLNDGMGTGIHVETSSNSLESYR